MPARQSVNALVVVAAVRRAILHLARLLHENYKLLATGKRLFFLRRLRCGSLFFFFWSPQGEGVAHAKDSKNCVANWWWWHMHMDTVRKIKYS